MSKPHPVVVHAQTFALTGVVTGLLLLAATSFFPSAWIYLAVAVTSAIAIVLFHRYRMRRAGWGEARAFPRLVAMLPADLAALSLMVYAVIVGVVHTDLFASRSNAFIARSNAYIAKLDRADAELRRLTRSPRQSSKNAPPVFANELLAAINHMKPSLRLELSHSRSAREIPRILSHAGPEDFTPGDPSAAKTIHSLAAEVEAEERLNNASTAAVVPPSPNQLPPWFSRLATSFPTAAAVLAALVIALVFSRRPPTNRHEDALIRLAMLFSMVGLLASLVGSAPSIPRTVDAFLLGFVIAGVLSSTLSVGLIAGKLVR